MSEISGFSLCYSHLLSFYSPLLLPPFFLFFFFNHPFVPSPTNSFRCALNPSYASFFYSYYTFCLRNLLIFNLFPCSSTRLFIFCLSSTIQNCRLLLIRTMVTWNKESLERLISALLAAHPTLTVSTIIPASWQQNPRLLASGLLYFRVSAFATYDYRVLTVILILA